MREVSELNILFRAFSRAIGQNKFLPYQRVTVTAKAPRVIISFMDMGPMRASSSLAFPGASGVRWRAGSQVSRQNPLRCFTSKKAEGRARGAAVASSARRVSSLVEQGLESRPNLYFWWEESVNDQWHENQAQQAGR